MSFIENKADFYFGFSIGWTLFALIAVLILTPIACNPPTAPADPPFVGRWAAEVGPGLGQSLLTMEFRSDGSATLEAYSGSVLMSRAEGRWLYREPRLMIAYGRCQSGAPPILIPCPNPDTLRPADIVGDSWRVSFIDSGRVETYNYRRSN